MCCQARICSRAPAGQASSQFPPQPCAVSAAQRLGLAGIRLGDPLGAERLRLERIIIVALQRRVLRRLDCLTNRWGRLPGLRPMRDGLSLGRLRIVGLIVGQGTLRVAGVTGSSQSAGRADASARCEPKRQQQQGPPG
jgi:hypothetical protein